MAGLVLHEALVSVIHLFFCGRTNPDFLVALAGVDLAEALESQHFVTIGVAFPVIVARPELGFDNFVQNLVVLHPAVI